jgi:hypothetical protein
MSDTLSWTIDQACGADALLASKLGLTTTQFAAASAFLMGALAWGFLAAWFLIFGKLRRAGFGRRQQVLVWWFAIIATFVQMTLTLLQGVNCNPIHCPWSSALLLGLAILFLLMAYGFHIQDENKGSGSRFILLVALPVIGEVAVTAKVTITSVLRFVIWIAH